ncbi:hypothetical protein ACQKWADRAFT_305991 [Trichoderma austrokoningii]
MSLFDLAVALAKGKPAAGDANCFFCNNLQFESHGARHGGPGLMTSHHTAIQGVDSNQYSITIPTRYLLRHGWRVRGGQDLDDCAYCQLLHDALNCFFIDGTTMNWITDCMCGWDGTITVAVQAGLPLILHCAKAINHSERWVSMRGDIQVFCHDRSALSAADFLPSMHLALPEPAEKIDVRDFSDFVQSNMAFCNFAPARMDECRALPPRLLQVDWDAQRMRLVHPRPRTPGQPREAGTPKISSYATLSHCWSETHQYYLKLKRSNIREWIDGVAFDQLPQGFYDAVAVAHAHGIRHLWIESLCILQDHQPDLDLQRPHVGTHFRNATLTIVAASCPTPADSFLFPYREGWIMGQAEFTAASGATVTIDMRRKASHRRAPRDAMDEALYRSDVHSLRRVGPLYAEQRRYQEALLSTRLITFTSAAITVDCRLHGQCEAGVVTRHVTNNNLFGPMVCAWEDPAFYRHHLARHLGPDPVRGMRHLAVFRSVLALWLHAIEQYTARGVVVSPRDKLLAVAGLARLAPLAAQSRYLAGIWAVGLHEGLLWQLRLRQGQAGDARVTFPPSQQGAPSFSWASVDAGVGYVEPFKGSLAPTATLVEASCRTVTGDPFGDVAECSLKLRGRLITCRVIQPIGEPAEPAELAVARFLMRGNAAGRGTADGRNAMVDDRNARPIMRQTPFVADGPLVTVTGPLRPRQRLRPSQVRRANNRQRLVSEFVEWRGLDYLMRDHCDVPRKPLRHGQRTMAGPAYVFCVGVRRGGQPDPATDHYESYVLEGLVVTPSLRHRGAYERIGCIRDIPMAAYAAGQTVSITLV